jgi:hypothetical protein
MDGVKDGNKERQISNVEPQVHYRYLDEFIGEIACAPQLLEMKIFPNAKEVNRLCFFFFPHLPTRLDIRA